LCEAERWLEVTRFRIDGSAGQRFYEVENSRAYRDRLVLKLKGIDDANRAAGLRGDRVQVARAEAPELPEDEHYVAELVGMQVVDESGREIGRVEGVVGAGDADVLRVVSGENEEDEAEELLIPLAARYVLDIDVARRRIEVRVPPELRELNRRPSG
jgi:16S rRNA processing protein RimM